MERKTFLKRLGGAVLVTLPLMNLVSCSGSDDSGGGNQGTTRDCLDNGARNGNITQNHGHTLTVPKSDIEAGTQKTYTIQGSSQHTHNITISADDFATLRDNQQVVVNSTNNESHTHSVTVVCA